MEREYVVVVHNGVDLEAFDAELAASTGTDYIPCRTVDIVNPRIGSKRMTHWALTDEEAKNLANDPRVLSVEIPVDQRDDVTMVKHAYQDSNFLKTSGVSGVNWGLKRCISLSNNFGSATTASGQYEYALDGTGVDIVIQDSGIEPNHPEWQDANGVSRYRTIDWYAASGVAGTQNANHDRDWDGHGTHCAGIAAGKTYGWAKNAHIYSQKLGGLELDGATGIPIADAFDCIRLWHNNKPITETGFKRPTVVNMSWGYGSTVSGTPTGGLLYNEVAGTMDPWTFGSGVYTSNTNLWQYAGIVTPLILGIFRRIPLRVPSVDAEIDEMIAAGIHVCIAAGNDYYVSYSDVPIATPDHHNNEVYIGGSTFYYHRGSSPRSTSSDDCFVVGNIDSDVVFDYDPIADALVPLDKIADSSTKGPMTNIIAPGTNIISTVSNINDGYSTASYPEDPSYLIANLSGTSMAAPQIAGVCAQHLQVKPWLTPTQLFTEITNDATDVVYDIDVGTPTDYFNFFDRALYGSPNRMLFTKYGRQGLQTNLSGNIGFG